MSSGAGEPSFWTVDPDAAAGEYVLGTLDPVERASFTEALGRDPSLRAAVAAWEERLAPLAMTTPPLAPDSRIWAGIEARIGATSPTRAAADDGILGLKRKLRYWQLASGAATALAAGLALWIAVAPRIGSGEAPQYLAVVDRGGSLPALIVRVDLQAGLVQVRSVAAQAPPDRSLELWYINEGDAPRSLGLVTDATANRPIPAALRAGVGNAKFAVTLEPKGGAPEGKATGPVIYSGQLIRE